MSINKKWSSFTKDKVSEETDNFGVYEIAHQKGNRTTILYHGEGRLRSRLLAHIPDGSRDRDTIVGANVYRVEETQSKLRAVQRQNALLRDHKRETGDLPRFNQRKKN